MSMLKTQLSGYEPLRSDVTIGDTATYLDPAVAGRSLDFSSKPSYAKELTSNHNNIEIIFQGKAEAADADAFSCRLWGYAANGPAERICDLSVTIGTARIGGSTTALWADTITIDSDTHVSGCNVEDVGNNRIAKLNFDNVGYSWLLCDFTTQGVADLSQKVDVLFRPY